MKRNYGIDLLRIISIFMVIILHVLGQGAVLYFVKEGTANYYISWFFEMASFCAVNCFALISGYVGFGKSQKPSAIISLSAQALFYIIVFTVAGCMANGSFDKDAILSSVMSFREGGFWYFKAYLCAWFFFPCINIAVEKLDKKQLKRLAIVTFIFFSVVPTVFYADLYHTGLGYSTLWLLVLYFYGAYIKKCGLEQNKKPWKYLLFYLLAVVVTWAVVIAVKPFEKENVQVAMWLEHFMSFTSPPIVLAGLFMFIAIANIKPGKVTTWVIKKVAPLTFGVYLVHTQYYVWHFIEEKFIWIAEMPPFYAAASILGVTAGIFIICAIIEYVRRLIFKITRIDNLIKKADKK